MKRYQLPRYMIPVRGKWKIMHGKEIDEGLYGDPASVDEYIYRYQQNPLSFYLPHGRNKRRHSFRNDGQAFLSDNTHDLVLLVCPNQVGKTSHGSAYVGLRCLPTDPKWTVFTEHKVKRVGDWAGPKEIIAASFAWDNVGTLWEEYQKFFPRSELGRYAPNYGCFEGETGRPRLIRFGDGKPKSITLTCGTRITFLCYTQGQEHWEGKKCDLAHLDEQCPEDKFDGLSFRQATRGDFTPIIMTLTGHILNGRPDTGAGGWINQKIVKGVATKGRKIAEYNIGIPDVPNEIMDKKTKESLRIQFVEEPERLQDEKKMREGVARYHGGWEVGGGIIISAWNPEIHIIEPFDYTRFNPTYYRTIDHGENPCASLIYAVMPWGDTVIIGEYYEYGNSIARNCKGIVEDLCGNERATAGSHEFEGQIWTVYDEVERKMPLYSSEMDARSYGTTKRDQGRLLGTTYNENGCMCTPADARKTEDTIPLMLEYFELDKDHPHINSNLGLPVPEDCVTFGAPRIYSFNTNTNLHREIEGWMYNPKTGKPMPGNDHLVDNVKYYCARERGYYGDYYEKRRRGTDGGEQRRDICDETAY